MIRLNNNNVFTATTIHKNHQQQKQQQLYTKHNVKILNGIKQIRFK